MSIKSVQQLQAVFNLCFWLLQRCPTSIDELMFPNSKRSFPKIASICRIKEQFLSGIAVEWFYGNSSDWKGRRSTTTVMGRKKHLFLRLIQLHSPKTNMNKVPSDGKVALSCHWSLLTQEFVVHLKKQTQLPSKTRGVFYPSFATHHNPAGC